MSVPAAPGTPQLADVGAIMKAFEKRFNTDYRRNTLIAKVTTGRYYEGVLKQGHEVSVVNLPEFTSRTYTKNSRNREIDFPIMAETVMTVNRARDLLVGIDAIDKKQTHLLLEPAYMDKMGYTFDKDVDTEFWADIVSQAATGNFGNSAGVISGNCPLGTTASPIAVTSANVVSLYSLARQVMEEQGSDNKGQGLWMVGPAYLRYALMNSDLKNASLSGDPRSILRSGEIGLIDQFRTFASNLLPAGYLLAGNMDAISYISQLRNMAMISGEESEYDHINKLKGLFVYDWKVRKPEGLVVFEVTDGTKA